MEVGDGKETKNGSKVLLIEPFYGGSHKQLIDLLAEQIPDSEVFTLPAKKWHWRARTSALHFASAIPQDKYYRVLFCSSVLCLAELVALRPDLGHLHKILYFHENQLVYPVRKQQERDFQYGYNQILSCLVADVIVFNSKYNQDSFLNAINSFMKIIPDFRPKGLVEKIKPKCKVLHFPIKFPPKTVGICHPEAEHGTTDCDKDLHNQEESCMENYSLRTDHTDDSQGKETQECSSVSGQQKKVTYGCVSSLKPHSETPSGDIHGKGEGISKFEDLNDKMRTLCNDREVEKTHTMQSCIPKDGENCLHIVWPHRWEHDKDPTTLFNAMFTLQDQGYKFRLSVLGETYTDVPDIFQEAKIRLSDSILHWGYQSSKRDYNRILQDADVVVSTAKHEFFGVAMLEAVYFGCYPLCPNDLVYPEIFCGQYLYNTPAQLVKKLKHFCKYPAVAQREKIQVDPMQYSWERLSCEYQRLLMPC